jgi:hypothetical protein
MYLRNAVLCLLGAISTLAASTAMAHIDFKGEFECKASYEKDCYLFSADLDHRTMRIFFDGTPAENGSRCETRTTKLALELGHAIRMAGGSIDDIAISSIRYGAIGERGLPGEFRCSYEVVSKRKDLRFQTHHFNRRFWTSQEEQAGVCMDDVRAAQAIPGSIGAAKWMTAALLQGYMCNTNYATLGFDRMETDSNGVTKLVKFGSDPTSTEQPSMDDSLRN